jgi:Ca2+-binding EF-hand superfamily protein
MMIAIIIENFLIALKREENSLRAEHAEAFKDTWSQYDPDATGRIHVKHLVNVVKVPLFE